MTASESQPAQAVAGPRDGLARLRLPRRTGQRVLWGVRAGAIVLLVAFALTTPGFLTAGSLLTLLDTLSFVGCVAVGMTFITLSGNIMSFSLGATLSATMIVFIAASLSVGVWGALAAAFLFSAALSGVQGWVIGYFRANPIIVTMAMLALITGLATFFTGGKGVYPRAGMLDFLKEGRIGPVPLPLVAFLVSVALGQFVLSFTHFGRNLYMVGSNPRAAEAAGIVGWRTVTGAYAVAGFCTAVSAILMASRYSTGDMTSGAGYEYQAISAVLVGGTAIQGGEGSAVRTLFGAFIIALVEGLLLLNGFSTSMQYFLVGVIVLGVIMLQTVGGSR
jgi:ribose/xylose/arabinose/galactoside ABC-type transport system permease subunit